MSNLKEKLKDLPRSPGVYYHLDKKGQVIYVGKAADLKSRVRHYFQEGQALKADSKTLRLREQISDVKWTTVDDPLQALFLESEMIKRYQPKYNVRERNVLSDSWYYIQINLSLPNPNLLLTRTLSNDDKLLRLGPYIDGRALKKALRYLRRSFPFSSHKTLPAKACLDYHLGLCPGPETESFDFSIAKTNLRRLAACLNGRQGRLLKKLQSAMEAYAEKYEYEAAAKIRNQIAALKNFKQSIVFPDFDKSVHLEQDKALSDLRSLLNLKEDLERIEAYDISHISGRYTTASMIVAQAGVVRPDLGRRFKADLAGNNDYGQIREIMRRRFNSKSLSALRPNLILIDGGRGQVSSVLKVLDEFGLEIPVVGLAKKKEQIIFHSEKIRLNCSRLEKLKGTVLKSPNFTTVTLNLNTPLIKLLQRLRDSSHRSALTYHNYLQTKAQVKSDLLYLPAIGPKTHQKLIKRFGSVDKLSQASEEELAELLNKRQLAGLLRYLKSRR